MRTRTLEEWNGKGPGDPQVQDSHMREREAEAQRRQEIAQGHTAQWWPSWEGSKTCALTARPAHGKDSGGRWPSLGLSSLLQPNRHVEPGKIQGLAQITPPFCYKIISM